MATKEIEYIEANQEVSNETGALLESQEDVPEGFFKRFWAWIVLLSLGCVWGLTFSLAKIAADGGGHPLGIAYWESLIGAVALISFCLLKRQPVPMKRRHIIFYILCGLLGSAIPNTIYFYAASRISPGVLSITIATVPLMTFAAAAIFRFEKLVLRRVLGIVFGMLSIILLVGPEESMPDPASVIWVLVGVFAAFCYATENMIIAMRAPEGLNPISIAAGMFIASSAALTPFMFVEGVFVPLAWPWGAVEWSIITISLVSVFAYSIFIYLVMNAGPVFASQTAYVVTLSGVFWGVLIFNEQHSFWIWISLAVMIAALALVTPKKKEKNAVPNNDLMGGFPPTPENQVTLKNWRQPPFNTWGFQHVSEITMVAPVYNDPDNIRRLERDIADLTNLDFEHDGQSLTLCQMMDYTAADGLVVLHKGYIVFEEYRNHMTARSRHILFSVTKSVTSLVAGVLVGRGQLDPGAPVTQYVPEVADTAFGDAKVRNVLDMTVALDFDEDYTATEGPIVQYRESTGWNPRTSTPPDMHLRDFLQTLKDRKGGHGERFSYMSPVSDLLGWIIERASGMRFADLVSETLWQPMGAGYDAYMSVDGVGAPRTAGGLCATLRDLALVGQLLCDGGKRDDQQIVPAEWIADIRNNGSRELWLAGDYAEDYKDWPIRYRNKWYIMGEGDAPFFGAGIHGQFIYVNPECELVVAQFSSQPDAVDENKELAFLRGCGALAQKFI